MSKITAENAADVISKYILRDVWPIVLDLERSKGNQLYDSHGKRFLLDCFGYLASNPVGHNHPGMFEPEFEKKLLRAARAKPSCSDFFTVEMAEYVDTFARIAMPPQLQHLFVVDGGTLAVENAIKTAFDWKVRLNQKRGIVGERGHQVIHFTEAFHGRSGYTLSMTNTADPRKIKFFPKFKWPRIPRPAIIFPLEGKNLENVCSAEQVAIQAIKQAFVDNKDDIAAIIIEPIQGEGGDNHFRDEFFKALRLLADENEAMLIFDEVQSGMGVTGRMWAYQHHPVVPDMIAFGKKAQTCGILVGSRVEQAENNVFVEASRINSTWGGTLSDMVRCQRYLEIMESEKLLENATTVGKQLVAMLAGLSLKFPQLTQARGKGLMCAVDLPTPQLRDQVHSKAFEKGALLLKCGTRSLRFRPALTFSAADVAALQSILTDCLKEVLR